MAKQRWIGVLDCNNFFVSCERLFRPDLAERPVVVLSSNDGCIVARSQEVKDIGVPMGVPYFKVKDILQKHQTTVFSSHFALYRDLSRRVISVMQEELGQVEQYSVDEAFFVVQENPKATAEKVREAVERQVGIPVSVGVAATKTQAKYASGMAKRGTGVSVLNTADWLNAAHEVRLSDIWGVGGQLAQRYRGHGLRTVADLLEVDSDRVAQLFGIAGVRLQQELRGVSVYPLGQKRLPQQSIMSSRSFRTPTTDFSVLADAVAYHIRHAAADLRAMQQRAKVVRVSVRPSRHSHFFLRGGSDTATLVASSDDTFELLRIATGLLSNIFTPGIPYQKASITLTDLSSSDEEQGNLFAVTAENKPYNQTLMPVLDALNHRAGKEIVLLGSHLRTGAWQARHDARSPAYTTRWRDVPVVRAV